MEASRVTSSVITDPHSVLTHGHMCLHVFLYESWVDFLREQDSEDPESCIIISTP